jgi:hypothetical protein
VLRRADKRLSRQLGKLAAARPATPGRLFRAVLPAGPTVRALFVGVLDGHTLNVDLAVPPQLARDVTTVEVHVVRGAVRHPVPADVRLEGDALRVSAAALLCGLPAGLDLGPGDPWSVECLLLSSDGGATRASVHGAPTALPSGPTVPNPPCPDSGHRYRPIADRAGRLNLRVTAPAALAELTDLRLDWTRAVIELRAIGWSAEEPVEIELKPRDGGRPSRARGEVVGKNLLRFVLPLAPASAVSAPRESIFDVRVHTGASRLRVGTTLHDLANPKTALRPPAAIVWAGPGRSVRVRPYFTPAGSLALACLPVQSRPEDDLR